MRGFLTTLALVTLMACGGSEDPPPSSEPDSTGDEAPPAAETPAEETPAAAETCEGYAPTDGCMNETAFAQCQEMAAQCPGEVQVMESCPYQFGCP